MTLRPDLEALIQGALDDTLTPEERERLDRLMTESVEVRGRAAHLKELTDLLDSLGPAEPPGSLVQDVLAQISQSTDHRSDSAAAPATVKHRNPRLKRAVGWRHSHSPGSRPFVTRPTREAWPRARPACSVSQRRRHWCSP